MGLRTAAIGAQGLFALAAIMRGTDKRAFRRAAMAALMARGALALAREVVRL